MTYLNKDFVHMHVHSDRSQFDGLAKISELVLEARKMGFQSMALTDHGNVMGWVQFMQHCKMTSNKKGDIPYPPLKPILGMEAYLCRSMDVGQNEEKKDESGKPIVPKDLQPDGRKGNRHINLYAMNFEGYKNLCKLSQLGWTEGFYFDPRIDIETLSKYSNGLMGGSACLSNIINVNLLHGYYDRAKRMAGIFKEIFNKNFFLEVMYHGIPEEKAIIPDIFKIGGEIDIPVVVSNDSHYIKKEQADSQEVLMCMSSSKCIKDPKRMRFSFGEFYLKSAEELYSIFKNKNNCMSNSLLMSERIDHLDIEKNLFGGMRLPIFDIPKEYVSPFEYMEKLAWEGLKKHGWENSKIHIDTLKKELADIKIAKDNNNYDFSTYFLIVRDYIQYAKNNNIMVGAGRGSGYASILLRCLDITYGVDPIKYGLIWERFLGFSESRFILESDLGFDDGVKVLESVDLDEDDLEEDRELEDDLGGVDRY